MAVSTNGNDLNVTAANISLPGTASITTGTFELQTATVGTGIGLGSGAGGMTLSGTELQDITATSLNIGGANTGTITVSGVSQTNSANIGLVTLNAASGGSSVIFSGTASTFQALSASANTGISVQKNVTTKAGDLTLNGGSGNITFNAAVTMNAAGNLTVGAQGGGERAGEPDAGGRELREGTERADGGGAATVTATNGAVTFNGTLTTPVGNAVLSAGTDVNLGGDVTTAGTFTSTAGGNTTVSGNLSAGGAATVTSNAGLVTFVQNVTTTGTNTPLVLSGDGRQRGGERDDDGDVHQHVGREHDGDREREHRQRGDGDGQRGERDVRRERDDIGEPVGDG